MATYSTVKNVSDGPVIVDAAGHVIGAGEFGIANVEHAPARGLVEDGLLVAVERPDGDVELDASAAAAFTAADERNSANDGDSAPTPKAGRRAATTSEA